MKPMKKTFFASILVLSTIGNSYAFGPFDVANAIFSIFTGPLQQIGLFLGNTVHNGFNQINATLENVLRGEVQIADANAEMRRRLAARETAHKYAYKLRDEYSPVNLGSCLPSEVAIIQKAVSTKSTINNIVYETLRRTGSTTPLSKRITIKEGEVDPTIVSTRETYAAVAKAPDAFPKYVIGAKLSKDDFDSIIKSAVHFIDRASVTDPTLVKEEGTDLYVFDPDFLRDKPSFLPWLKQYLNYNFAMSIASKPLVTSTEGDKPLFSLAELETGIATPGSVNNPYLKNLMNSTKIGPDGEKSTGLFLNMLKQHIVTKYSVDCDGVKSSPSTATITAKKICSGVTGTIIPVESLFITENDILDTLAHATTTEAFRSAVETALGDQLVRYQIQIAGIQNMLTYRNYQELRDGNMISSTALIHELKLYYNPLLSKLLIEAGS
jgi:hypothetical protein